MSLLIHLHPKVKREDPENETIDDVWNFFFLIAEISLLTTKLIFTSPSKKSAVA